MYQLCVSARYKRISLYLFLCLGMVPLTLHASFIEATMGTAVVNDATATYHNPAALTLLKNPQFVALGSDACFHSSFTGQSRQAFSGFTQTGTSKDHTDYLIPSFYVGVPVKDKIKLGLAVISDMFHSDIDGTSIIRYTQANNSIKNMDLIPGIGIEINQYLSVGGGLSFSNARFTSNPVTGIPSLNIPDSQSHNVTKGSSYGGNAGFLIKPTKSTLIGLNYRSSVSYQFSGESTFEGLPTIKSNNYNFNFWTPARTVVTISHFIKPDLGIISTVQRVQWSVFKQVIFHDAATRVGTRPTIVPEVVVPYDFHDTWVATLGGIKYITPNLVLRAAASYDQAPASGTNQITHGDSYILGASMGYTFYKNMMIDGSYAHAFVKDQPININSRGNVVTGVNKGYRDAVSVKLTINIG